MVKWMAFHHKCSFILLMEEKSCTSSYEAVTCPSFHRSLIHPRWCRKFFQLRWKDSHRTTGFWEVIGMVFLSDAQGRNRPMQAWRKSDSGWTIFCNLIYSKFSRIYILIYLEPTVNDLCFDGKSLCLDLLKVQPENRAQASSRFSQSKASFWLKRPSNGMTFTNWYIAIKWSNMFNSLTFNILKSPSLKLT